jgi:hypothetical protein
MTTMFPLEDELMTFIERVRSKLVEQFEGIYDADLECGCAVSSYTLYRALLTRDVNASFVQGVFEDDEDHCWVVIDNHIIVDITARQFSPKFPPVYVTATDDRYHAQRTDRIAREFVAKNWPDEQDPRTHLQRIAQILESIATPLAEAS